MRFYYCSIVSPKQQANIDRHDRWYRKIVHRLLNHAQSMSNYSQDGPLTKSFWDFLLANCDLDLKIDKRKRDLLFSILLDPRVRSLHTRAALGRRDWRRDPLDDIPSSSLEESAPLMGGVHGLFGTEKACSKTSDAKVRALNYIGSSLDLDERLNAHRRTLSLGLDEIVQQRKNRKRKPTLVLYIHESLVELNSNVRYRIFSKYPLIASRDAMARQMKALIILDETTILIYQDTLKLRESDECFRDNTYDTCASHRLVHAVRPHDMPQPSWSSGNVGVSCRQWQSSKPWSPESL